MVLCHFDMPELYAAQSHHRTIVIWLWVMGLITRVLSPFVETVQPWLSVLLDVIPLHCKEMAFRLTNNVSNRKEIMKIVNMEGIRSKIGRRGA